MAFLKSNVTSTRTPERVEVSVSVPLGSEAAAKELLSNLNADEIETLRKVSKNTALKNMALAQAKKFV